MDYKPTPLTATGLNETCPYATPDELKWVGTHGFFLSNREAVMIGAGPGVFALALMTDRKRCPYLHVVEIGTFEWIQRHLEASDCDMNKVDFVHGDSKEIGKDWQTDIDFLLVDGDHTYEGVKSDIEAWLPHVRKGSMVFFHDYLEREGGFDGVGPWVEKGCALAVAEAIADGRLMFVRQIGISSICEKL